MSTNITKSYAYFYDGKPYDARYQAVEAKLSAVFLAWLKSNPAAREVAKIESPNFEIKLTAEFIRENIATLTDIVDEATAEQPEG